MIYIFAYLMLVLFVILSLVYYVKVIRPRDEAQFKEQPHDF